MTALAAILLMVCHAHAVSDIYTAANDASLRDLLSIGYDARSRSMGGVTVALPNGIGGVVTNPASIGYLRQPEAMVSYRPIILDMYAGAAAAAYPRGKTGIWAINLLYRSNGIIDQPMDNSGNPIDAQWGQYGLAGGVSWAKQLAPDLSVGATLKGILDVIGSDRGNEFATEGFSIDLGAQHHLMGSRLIVGATVRNLGMLRTGYDPDGSTQPPLPLTFATGFSIVPRHTRSLRFALDLEKPIDDFLTYRTGAELALYKQHLFARVGYAFSQRDLIHAQRTLKGTQDKAYQKTNWSGLALGAGMAGKVSEVDARVDAAINLRVNAIEPEYCLTIAAGF